MPFKNAHNSLNTSFTRLSKQSTLFPDLKIGRLPKRFHEEFVRIMVNYSLGSDGSSKKSSRKVALLVERYYRSLLSKSLHHIYGAYTRDPTPKLIGAVVLSTLHNLPLSDGIGEIKELAVDAHYRKQGVGSKLLLKSLLEAQKLGFQTLYLRTSPHLKPLASLLKRSGFAAVKQATPMLRENEGFMAAEEAGGLPSYYILRNAT